MGGASRSRSRHLTVLEGPNPSLLSFNNLQLGLACHSPVPTCRVQLSACETGWSHAYFKDVKKWRTRNSNGRCLCYPSNKNQVPKESLRNRWFSFISTSTHDMMVGSKCQVHTERSLTKIPTCTRPSSTTTNTKLTYNLLVLTLVFVW